MGQAKNRPYLLVGGIISQWCGRAISHVVVAANNRLGIVGGGGRFAPRPTRHNYLGRNYAILGRIEKTGIDIGNVAAGNIHKLNGSTAGHAGVQKVQAAVGGQGELDTGFVAGKGGQRVGAVGGGGSGEIAAAIGNGRDRNAANAWFCRIQYAVAVKIPKDGATHRAISTDGIAPRLKQ